MTYHDCGLCVENKGEKEYWCLATGEVSWRGRYMMRGREST